MVGGKCLPFVLSTLLCVDATAQLRPPNDLGVAMGHLHIVVKDMEAHKKFWVEAMGATPVKLRSMEAMKLPGVLVFLTGGEPRGGTEATIVGQIGFKVRNLQSCLDKARAAGAAVPPDSDERNHRTFVVAPDNVKIELTEDRSLNVETTDHRIYFYSDDAKNIQAWYARLFGARTGRCGKWASADIPGVKLIFSKAEGTIGTKGRSIDHIGFEVTNLEKFCKKLEASGIKFEVPYQQRPELGIALAFLTDPWGTVIELTEGLNRL